MADSDFQSAKEAIGQMLRSFKYMIDNAVEETTKIYKGRVVSYNNDGRWNITYNGKTHPVTPYGGGTPTVNQMVYVFVPQGNQALSWFFIPGAGGSGDGDGVTFIPSVSNDGVISWTNDGGLPNPSPVNIRGPQGIQGNPGNDGAKGDTGPYYTPSVSERGDLSWTNNGNLSNPATVNIKGQQGDQGIQGESGATFTPSVDDEGNLSWSNDKMLDNPETVNIRGPQGNQGIQGIQGVPGQKGEQGETGPYFTPSVDGEGNLSWTNNGSLENPQTVNIKGPQGPKGDPGNDGQGGASATVNGVNALTITASGGLTGTQEGDTFTISASELQTALNNITNGTADLPYLKLTGGQLTGRVSIVGNASDGLLMTRGIWGSNAAGTATSDLYLQYGAGAGSNVRIGQSGQLIIDKTGNLTTSGSIETDQYLKVGNMYFVYDETTQSLYIQNSAPATNQIIGETNDIIEDQEE